jgi:hypothetical protein
MIRRPHRREIELLPQIENLADRRYARVGLLCARRGFIELPRSGWSRALRFTFMNEGSHGRPPWRRTIMRRHV